MTSSGVGGKGAGRQKVFVCQHEGCDKAYAVKSYLIEHERLHTGMPSTGIRVVDPDPGGQK